MGFKLDLLTDTEIEELDNQISDLYRTNPRKLEDELTYLTDSELVALLTLCFITDDNPYGAAYDDEVFDEVHRRSNSNVLLFAASTLWRTGYSYDMTNDIIDYAEHYF